MASPILPDGTLLSLPIPDKTGRQKYSDLSYKEQSYHEIIHQLNPAFDFSENTTCHFDPDIYEHITGRPEDWKPAFGQSGVSARHLDKLGVGIDDIFLFYGMFQKTEWQADYGLSYVGGSPTRHIIYGYMEVGEILCEKQDIEQYYWHPHSVNADRPYNRLYLPKTYGTFHYSVQIECDIHVRGWQGCDGTRLLRSQPWLLRRYPAHQQGSREWLLCRRADRE